MAVSVVVQQWCICIVLVCIMIVRKYWILHTPRHTPTRYTKLDSIDGYSDSDSYNIEDDYSLDDIISDHDVELTPVRSYREHIALQNGSHNYGGRRDGIGGDKGSIGREMELDPENNWPTVVWCGSFDPDVSVPVSSLFQGWNELLVLAIPSTGSVMLEW